MSKYLVIPLFLILCLMAGTLGFANDDPVLQQIRQWVQQLGNDSFLDRQRAETLLIRTGLQAYPELQRAKQNPEIEIARRAEYILSQIEQTLLDLENREAASWIHFYMLDPNPAAKARIIWVLADPQLDLSKGEGLPTLIRLVRFEENSALRLEAAKSLIASPPIAPIARQKWYQSIRDNIRSTDDDELLAPVADYAKLWCELDEADGTTLPKTTPEFQDRVRQVSTKVLRLLKRPENQFQIGSKIDILLHYAVAELQDAAGLIKDRDTTTTLALAIESEPIQTTEPILPIGLEDDLLMNEHYHVGLYLRHRFRLHWATAHFQKVIESGDVSLRIEASNYAADAAIFLADYPSAINFLDKCVEIYRGPDHERNNVESAVAQIQRRLAYCRTEKAAAIEHWEEVRKIIMQTWAAEPPGNRDLWKDGGNIDLLIMAHRLCKQIPDIDDEFKTMMNTQFGKTWNSITADFENDTFDITRQAKMVVAFNWGAWLLANTEGDYHAALTLIEAAMKIEPDDVSIWDTLAHVYFLGGKVDEAIRIQEQVVRFAPEAVVFQRALEQFKNRKAGDTNTAP